MTAKLASIILSLVFPLSIASTSNIDEFEEFTSSRPTLDLIVLAYAYKHTLISIHEKRGHYYQDYTLASLSKPITAAAVTKHLKNNNLGLDTKINALISLPQDIKEKTKDITVRQLLNHTSGIQKGYPFSRYQDPTYSSCLDVAIHHIRRSKKIEPNKEYYYSNVGYCLLGEVIVQNLGPYEASTKDILSLDSSFTIKKNESKQSDLHLSPYYLNPKILGPAGGWSSRPDSYLNFACDLEEDYITDSKYETSNNKYGIRSIYHSGWRVITKKNTKLRTHYGFIPGTFSLFIKRNNGMCYLATFEEKNTSPAESFWDIIKLIEPKLI